jgi:hypothetical protein
MTTLGIRPFAHGDTDRLVETPLVETLCRNGLYDYADVEWPAPMPRLGEREATVFLAAASGGQVGGPIRAVYERLPDYAVTPLSIDPEVALVQHSSPWRIHK